MTKTEAIKLIEIYGRAWEGRDADLVLSVFTSDATYFDPREGMQTGHAGIKAYWESKVIGSQKDISFKLLKEKRELAISLVPRVACFNPHPLPPRTF